MADKPLRNGEQNPDDKQKKKAEDEFGFSDSGLGDLPPLSEFESSSGGAEGKSVGGLPPISDIPMETPIPTGGNVRPAPPGFEDTPMFDTPVSDSGLDTPRPGRRQDRGTSFQDLAADSDFRPETPAIGPGPESDLETPMFDSAFGGAGGPRRSTPDTSAPTQAMETPMFGGARPQGGAAPDTIGFDEGAFGGGFAGGTPIPDFSPDTAAGVAAAAAAARPVARPVETRGGGGAGRVLVPIILLIVGLVVGFGVNPYLAKKMAFVPNPIIDELKKSDDQVATLRKNVSDLQSALQTLKEAQRSAPGVELSPEQAKKLAEEISQLTAQRDTAQQEVAALEQQRNGLRDEVDALNAEFATNQQQFEELQNQTEIVRARRDGLDAEVTRLQGLVGQLEEANARSQATRNSLIASVDGLAVAVREGMPLTPKQYNRDERVAAVDALRKKVADAKWVTPDLLNEYTQLYVRELTIAGARDYFFARIPVTDRFGSTYMKWAECLMNGNWSVYYRTLDGANVGVYENVAPAGATPSYAFREDLPPAVQKQIEGIVTSSRTPNYVDTVKILAQKEADFQPKSAFQRIFESL